MDMTKDVLDKIELNRDISITSARIFEQAALDGCDMERFTSDYLGSHFCKNRMETRYSSFQREDARTCLEFIYKEIGFPDPKETIFSPDAAWWLGYTFYQLYCETGMHGIDLLNIIGYEKMLRYYPAHHTLDEFYSTDIICEQNGIKKNEMYTEYIKYLES